MNVKTPHRWLDLSKATTLPLSSRPSKVREDLLANKVASGRDKDLIDAKVLTTPLPPKKRR